MDLTMREKSELAPHEHIIDAHKFLKEFLAKFDTAKRGGIHDFMELVLFNMVNSAIKNIDDYLQGGHTDVNATEIMNIVTDSYQKVLDNIRKNMDGMRQVNFK